MRAVTWHGKRDVRVDDVPDPTLQEPTDAIVRVTSTAICGSDLHLYEVLGAFMTPGDVLGHEPMGIVEEVGAAVPNLKRGDRVVVPFNIACGHCFMCDRALYSQCETTQVTAHGTGAALFGYSKLYGQVPADRPSISGFRRHSSAPSRFRRALRTTGSSSCRTCCRPHGRPSSTRTCRRGAASPSSASGPSERWRPALLRTVARAR
jgi:hypothetical protein